MQLSSSFNYAQHLLCKRSKLHYIVQGKPYNRAILRDSLSGRLTDFNRYHKPSWYLNARGSGLHLIDWTMVRDVGRWYADDDDQRSLLTRISQEFNNNCGVRELMKWEQVHYGHTVDYCICISLCEEDEWGRGWKEGRESKYSRHSLCTSNYSLRLHSTFPFHFDLEREKSKLLLSITIINNPPWMAVGACRTRN